MRLGESHRGHASALLTLGREYCRDSLIRLPHLRNLRHRSRWPLKSARTYSVGPASDGAWTGNKVLPRRLFLRPIKPLQIAFLNDALEFGTNPLDLRFQGIDAMLSCSSASGRVSWPSSSSAILARMKRVSKSRCACSNACSNAPMRCCRDHIETTGRAEHRRAATRAAPVALFSISKGKRPQKR